MSGLMDMLAAQPTQADKVMGLLGLLGGSGPQSPGGPSLPDVGGQPYSGNLPAHELALQVARRIERRPGFEVAGLRGWEGQGPVSSGHIEGSQHYGPGFAGDVNYVGGGRFGGESAALSWLENWLQNKYGSDLTELIWQEPDHYDHLHYGTRPGG
jgi:hypothetical protein